MPRSQPRTHYRTCNLCEAMCGLTIEATAERVISIRGDDDDPLSRGYLCPKGAALKDLQEDPDRLSHPLRKTRTGFEPVAWDEALDETAQRIFGIQERHGRDAFAVYIGNPVVHNFGALVFGPLFLRTLRTKNRYSATSVDQLPSMFASFFMFGHQLLFPIPDIDRTRHFLMLGANPAASNGSLMSAPGIKKRLRDLRERGGKLVVIDPRRTETAELADEHHFIRPGTDALLLLAMLHVVFREGLDRLDHLGSRTKGLAALRKIVEEFTPAWAATHTGIDEATIERLTHEFGKEPAAVCYGRLGTCAQEFGALCQWAINALNVCTGHLDRVGGAMFTEPALDTLKAVGGMGVGPGHFDRWQSRVRGLPEFGGELPVSVLAEEIETDGPGQIQGLLTIAGNPALSTPNGQRLQQAFGRLDFMASLDIYLNETTRHADIIFPASSPLERGHFDPAFNLLAVRNVAKYSPPLFEPRGDTRPDWDTLLRLQERLLELRGDRSGAWKARGLRKLGPERLLDAGLRAGPYGLRLSPPRHGLSLRRLRQSEHGIDLGPLRPCLLHRMPAGRSIDLVPGEIVADLQRLRDSLPKARTNSAANGFVLIGRRHLRSNNSWMHNLEKLVGGNNRCSLLMHPEDVAGLDAKEGDEVVVRSAAGELRVTLESTDAVMRGVVSLPHGFGHGVGGTRQKVAEAHAGQSVNDLTDPEYLDQLSGNAALNGIPVEVRAV
ncbi:MAG: molybdopterin-dependent oxidoreductase [Myxococcota bacterium]